jgi:hypothetical protein
MLKRNYSFCTRSIRAKENQRSGEKKNEKDIVYVLHL